MAIAVAERGCVSDDRARVAAVHVRGAFVLYP